MGELPAPNPASSWISEKMWGEVCRSSDLGPKSKGLIEHVTSSPELWKRIYDSLEPQSEPLPAPW